MTIVLVDWITLEVHVANKVIKNCAICVVISNHTKYVVVKILKELT